MRRSGRAFIASVSASPTALQQTWGSQLSVVILPCQVQPSGNGGT